MNRVWEILQVVLNDNRLICFHVKLSMGTWGIARDMAKRNEENLSMKKGRSHLYKQFVQLENGKKTLYRYKKASPVVIGQIRRKMQDDQARSKRNAIILGTICGLMFITIIWAALSF